MRWSQLRTLTDSKAYWSLNALFVVIPLVSRLGVPLNWELVATYIATWLLFIAGTAFFLLRPPLIGYRDYADYLQSGKTADQLLAEYLRCGGRVPERNDDSHLANRLRNDNKNSLPDTEVFWHVYHVADVSGRAARVAVTTAMFAAALMLLAVNVNRFYDVITSYLSPQKEMRMPSTNPPVPVGTHLTTGGTVDVQHEDGTGSVSTTSGKLVDIDDNGFLVVRANGKLIYIPKHRVVDIKQSA